jgi:hypothetical protein
MIRDMGTIRLTPGQAAVLSTLAGGIIPPDETDAGAAGVDAGPRIRDQIEAGVNDKLYMQGLEAAGALARQAFGRGVHGLEAAQVHELLGMLRTKLPVFFKQLRMDVSALYLSDPGVWERIGFPGPSTETGGYPDFDRPQQDPR